MRAWALPGAATPIICLKCSSQGRSPEKGGVEPYDQSHARPICKSHNRKTLGESKVSRQANRLNVERLLGRR